MALLRLQIDWFEAFGWNCPFCGGDIDHLHEEVYEEAGYSDDSYQCQEHGGGICEYAYFMVRFSHKERGLDGDALTIKRFIEVEISDVFVNEPDAQSDMNANGGSYEQP